jgi:hypothetical protein
VPSAQRRSGCAPRDCQKPRRRDISAGGQSFGIPSWTGNESISRNPSGVPILNSFTAHGAFKAADLARLCNVFAAVINRAALKVRWVPIIGYHPPPHSNGTHCPEVRIASGSRLPLAASFISSPSKRRMTPIDPLDAPAVVIPRQSVQVFWGRNRRHALSSEDQDSMTGRISTDSRRKPPVRAWLPYCFSAGGFASGVGAGASGSGVGVAPRSSGAATQSPAQILVPLTDPNCLQAIGADGVICFNRLPPTLGAAV